MKKNILITGAFRFPDRDAAAHRVLGIANSLRENNIKSIFCGWEHSPRKIDIGDDGIARYNGYEYHSQNELDLNHTNILKKGLGYINSGSNTIKWIKQNIKKYDIGTVLVYNSGSIFLIRLFILSKVFGFKLICDLTEWNDATHLPGGKYGIVSIDLALRMKFVCPYVVKKMIVISSFLNNYYEVRKCKTIILPPMVDVYDDKWKSKGDKKKDALIKIIYAGNPGKKDHLEPIIKALEEINKVKTRIELVIIGVDNKYIQRSFQVDKTLSFITAIGRVEHNMVIDYYNTSHFSIILRDNKRYANAGFPTKLVESLTVGVPVITNDTSDISKYIHDGENGFMLKDMNLNSIISCFNHILHLDKNEINSMSIKSRNSSLSYFDYRNYSKDLMTFIK